MSLLLLLRPLAAPVGPQPPNIVSFSPISGPIGTVVTISGSNFTGATDVSFNGTAAITFNVDSDFQITATVPVGATTGLISVTNAVGTGSSTDPFTITVPVVVVASDTAARAKKRRQVRIKYEDFKSNPEFLKSFLQLPEFDESKAKRAEQQRIERREAKMRAKAAALAVAEEARLRALTAEIDAKNSAQLASEKAAETERARIAKINNAIIMMLLSDES